jgi:HAD superfamily hydrolase (TIGR01509 family)
VIQSSIANRQSPIPSVVIFDLGKVLVDFDYTRAGQRIAAFGSVLPEVVRQFIDHSPLLVRYETGLISTTEFFAAVREATHFRGTAAEFAAAFADIFTPLAEMIALHAALRARGIPTYILSNTNDLAIAHIRRSYPFFANFDGYVLSYEVGAMKPDAAIYLTAEKLAGKCGAEILFLDDRADNIAAATARGWQVIHHQTPAATRARIEQLGLL